MSQADRNVVLLTGLPSLLARTVCEEILRTDGKGAVRALVRPNERDEMKTALDALGVEWRGRVDFVEGDAASIDFGLSGNEYRALTHEVTHVHHCAHITDLGVDRARAERINIGGAHEALEFARCCGRLQCLVFHSTAHVSGDRSGVVYEDDLNVGQSFRNVIEETQARAEKLMRAAMSNVPVAVVRPGTLVGDSRTGAIDRFDGPYLLILLVVTSPPDLALPLPGRGDEPVNVVPVDWVARAAVAIGRDRRARGGTFHLVDPSPLTARRVFELVARAGGRRGPRGSIPANLAKALLRAPGLDRIAKSPRAFLETMTTAVTYDARRADEVLAAAGVPPCPPLDTYIDTLVDFVKERMRQRRASKKDPPASVDEGSLA
ncbi:MAG: SDR family oxidoreductase [Polyangiaceae bacterium]|jgi:thioester reductase-like protein